MSIILSSAIDLSGFEVHSWQQQLFDPLLLLYMLTILSTNRFSMLHTVPKFF